MKTSSMCVHAWHPSAKEPDSWVCGHCGIFWLDGKPEPSIIKNTKKKTRLQSSGKRSSSTFKPNSDPPEPQLPKWDCVTDADLRGAIAAAKYLKDRTAARNLIEYFHERFRDGNDFNYAILIEFVSHAFSKIIEDGYSADQAFGLRLRKGQYPRPDTFERDIQAAAYMILLMRNDKIYADAIGDVANCFFPDGEGDRAVEAAYSTFKDGLSILPSEVLQSILGGGSSVINKI